ncbi:MAG: tetratricopeptide repeat protein, partial [Myxococcales bacterium]|nr:tetratricopeptide repeat protein [Myxococcales bacterium]
YALQTVGDCQSLRGRLNAAEEVLQQALRLLGARGDGWLRARILLRLAGVAHKRGDDERARTLSAEAAELFRRAGTRAGVAEAYSVMGDLARRAGDFAEAERQYRESRRLFSALSAGGVHAAECSLAMVLIESGRFGEARDVLERALAATLSGGHAVRQFLFAAMLACAADAWDWATWDRCMAEIGPLLQGRLTDLDVAIAARRAAELAEIAGQGQRADDAWRLAYEQYEAMGRRTEADQLNREIESVRRRRQVNPGILTRFDP